MGIKWTILIYTHSDMADVWPMFFGQLTKYGLDTKFEIYVAVNKNDERIPYTQLYYNDKLSYTDRLKSILEQISDDTILFIHEDMVLYDTPNFGLLNRYFNYVYTGYADSIKLIYVENGITTTDLDETLVTNPYAKFSIQPTIIKTSRLNSLLDIVGSVSIWDFEHKAPYSELDFMSKIGNENRRGSLHYDSSVFPYIATAITKGKWNYNQYKVELDNLFEQYNINPFERGIL